MTAISVLAVPVAATLLALLADRQRLKRLWPLLGIALLLLATPMFGYRFGHHHHRLSEFQLWPGDPNTVEHRGALLAPMLSHALVLLSAAWLIARRKGAA